MQPKNLKKPMMLPAHLSPDTLGMNDYMIRRDSSTPTKNKVLGYFPGHNLLTARSIKRQHNYSPDSF